MPFWVVKPRMSWPVLKPVPIVTVAPTKLAVSTSVTVKLGSMAVAAWFSV